MKLEVANYNVEDVRWAEKSYFADSCLYLSKRELKDIILEDELLEDVELVLTKPGENTRIVNILDMFDARCKASDEGTIYPGFTNDIGTPGIGRTNVLTGFSIAEIGKVENLQAFTEIFLGVLDMNGPGAEVTEYSKNHVLSLVFSCKTKNAESMAMVHKRACAKISEYIAKTTINKKPNEIKVYEMNPCKRGEKKLPRVGYIYYTESQNHLKETYFYGINSHYFVPFTMHPNEVMDGAMVCMMYEYSAGHRDHTISMCNNPVVQELYSKHGKEIEFGGMIVCNAHLKHTLKKSVAYLAAKIAKYNLELDAVVITKEGGGHPVTDLMLCGEECEKAGLKTALITEEVLNPDGTGMSTVFYSPHVDLVVSTGNHEELVDIPQMENLVGYEKDHPKYLEMIGPRKIRSGVIPGALQITGHTKLGCKAF